MDPSTSKEILIGRDTAVNRRGSDSRAAFRAACACVLAGLSAISIMKPALADDDARSSGWNVALGTGVASLPKYPGSRARRVEALPALTVSYGRFFINPDGLGTYLEDGTHWKLGVVLNGDPKTQRVVIDDPRLHGLGNINGTVRAGLLASYTLGWFTLDGNVSYDLEDHHNHQGGEATLKAIARYSPLPRLTLTGGPEVTFANQRYMQTFFGIDALQSLRSGYSEYKPKSGIAYAGVSLGLTYELTSHWSLTADANARRLGGDAARSVIVEKKNQSVFAFFAAYTF